MCIHNTYIKIKEGKAILPRRHSRHAREHDTTTCLVSYVITEIDFSPNSKHGSKGFVEIP
jgi:hypothetical protein